MGIKIARSFWKEDLPDIRKNQGRKNQDRKNRSQQKLGQQKLGKKNPVTLSPEAMWKVGFYLSVFITSALCMLTAVHQTLQDAIGEDAARILTVTATLSATLIAGRLREFWATGPMHVLWAALMTSFLASGTALAFTQVVEVALANQPLISLVSLPITFASAAFLVPISLYTHPMTLGIWLAGSAMNAYCARRTARFGHMERVDFRPR